MVVKNFDEQWTNFIKDNDIELMSPEDIARCFYEFGFSKGVINGT